MRKIDSKSARKGAFVVAVGMGLGCGVVFAQKPLPSNQREFDGAAARLSAAERDAVGHAFDNGAAKLFWFTDLERAKAQAKLENKPILSLRLLGNLTDEYSCANSRFFRVIFYPQAQINPLLRDKFVLHWSRERPVPIVTIDMGDGRQIKRTLTGNSAHYLLDSSGRPLDVMPGVVTPARFAKWLETGAQLNDDFAQTAPEKRDEFLIDWHRAQLAEAWREFNPAGAANERWFQMQIKNSLEFNPLEKPAPTRVQATLAAPLAVSKMIGEAPILDATRLFGSGSRVASAGLPIGFNRLGASAQPALLDTATRERIRALNPLASAAADAGSSLLRRNGTAQAQLRPVAATQVPQTDPFDALITLFENSIRADDRMSLARFQIPVHATFMAGTAGDFPSLNRKIYDRLFLTPKSDPWLGLAADGVFTGLQNGGIIEAKKDSAE